jgi:hypothetical protein
MNVTPFIFITALPVLAYFLIEISPHSTINSKTWSFEKAQSFNIQPNFALKNSPTPMMQPNNDSQSLLFIYPNSQIVDTPSGSLILESLDSPAVITDWYKNKIHSLGMTQTSFIQTNNNGEILNKLMAGKSGQKISVEIDQNGYREKVRINLNVLP